MKTLLSGNEAVARGAYEAGCAVGTGYPGTPGTEILENLAGHREVRCQWSVNEKVALEVGCGASIAGCRVLVAMKHVGLNVAADPLFTIAYEGVGGGLVIVSADDPGPHSSQNEQDNRHYATHAKVALLEPSDSQECLDYTRLAFEVSERFDIPVLLRLTTRICHGRSLVREGEPKSAVVREYRKDPGKYVPIPENSGRLHRELEEKLQRLARYAEDCPLNRVEWGSRKTGVITSGVCYQYVREVLGDDASYLKLGLTHPLPRRLIGDFAAKVDELFVVEENDPFLETRIRAMGIACKGKPHILRCGELNAGLVAGFLRPEAGKPAGGADIPLARRVPVLCAGCPHRSVFYALGKYRDVVVTNDIGCYTLGISLPGAVTDTCLCMGGGFTVGMGFDIAGAIAGRKTRVVGVMGDSTFFHSGMTGLVNAVHHGSSMTLIILDNRSTAMTGHQENPGTGRTLTGAPAKAISIEAIAGACGVDGDHLRVVDPYDLPDVEEAVREGMECGGLFVIIARRPCVMAEKSAGKKPARCAVIEDLCLRCGVCLQMGCPALGMSGGRVSIDPAACRGCGLCMQACPPGAIERMEEP